MHTWLVSGARTQSASEVGEVSSVDKRQVEVPGPSWSAAFSTADKGIRRRAWEASSLMTHNIASTQARCRLEIGDQQIPRLLVCHILLKAHQFSCMAYFTILKSI